jgi:hypothetical protein
LLGSAVLDLSRRLDPDPPPAHPYAEDPVGFVADVLGDVLWSVQKQILLAVRDHRRVAVPSAHEVGKSFVAGRLVAWWIETNPVGEAMAVTTATTEPQVKFVLWREINRAHVKGGLMGRTTQKEWWIGREVVAFGRKPADYDPTAFQGIHARRVLVVVDEAAGVPEELIRAGQSLAANEHSRLLLIGNPTVKDSYFEEVCKPGSGWHVITINGLESPNFTGEYVPDEVRDVLLSRSYVDELRDEVGEDSPIYQSRVLGRFPTDNEQGVVPYSWVQRCLRPSEPGMEDWTVDSLLALTVDADEEPDATNDLGVDVGAGGDNTSVRHRLGPVAGRGWSKRTPDPKDASALIIEALDATGATRIKVDEIGVGWGLVRILRDVMAEREKAGDHVAKIIPVNVATAAAPPRKKQARRFLRLRDQLWWEVGRENSRLAQWDLTLVDDKTITQLTQPLYDTDSAGRIVVESKKDLKKRVPRATSPDEADALLLAFYEPVTRRWGAV